MAILISGVLVLYGGCLGGLIYVVNRQAQQQKRLLEMHKACSEAVLTLSETIVTVSNHVLIQGARVDAHAALLRARAQFASLNIEQSYAKFH